MKRSFFLAMVVAMLAIIAAQDVFAANQLGIKLPEDPTKAYITLGILVIAAIMFFTEVVPLPITALLVPVALSLTNVISSKVAFSYFGDPTVVLFMAMFIVGEATFITGFADKVGALAVRLSKGNPIKLLVYAMAAVGLLSSVLSNTGTTVVAVPMILGMCMKAKLAPGKVLMPVAFAASLGGTVTLVGTPPNGIINSMLSQTGQSPFGFFEFGLIGIPLLVAGLLYYGLIGHRFLPEGRQIDDAVLSEEAQPRRENKMWHAMAVFAFVVFMMASELVPLTTAAMFGACMMVITGCMTMREAFRSVDWTTIFLFAGMLSMSAAMDKSGAAAIVANAVVSTVSDPWLLMLVCCALTAIITNFMSNTATAALMAPLALPIALGSGISPLPIIMGIAMSASACFLTPIATPPNTIVLGPGRYTFLDYVKAGWPLQLITLIMCWLLIPLIWPFH
ncbi:MULTISPECIES: SLC13 family permease [unclassified Desulfovibrio]|uniref:SLC13 family permease n=1 Tax=unclassified Desulfovibrio TaxID=2593640 RepID=UPI002FDB63A0